VGWKIGEPKLTILSRPIPVAGLKSMVEEPFCQLPGMLAGIGNDDGF
jgi:hypothetical protein